MRGSRNRKTVFATCKLHLLFKFNFIPSALITDTRSNAIVPTVFLCISLITSSENLVLSQCQIPLLMLMVFVILFALVPDNILYGETGCGSVTFLLHLV